MVVQTASPTAAYLGEVARRARAAHQPGAVAHPATGGEHAWVEVPGDEVGEILMQAWAINGIDHLFFSSGSDIGWVQEAAVKLRALGRPTPRIITMLHENTSLYAACGLAMVAHRPSLTMAHIDLGTLNYGGAIHNAARGRYPVLMTAGKTPNTLGALRARGGRDQAALFRGDMADYGAIVRQYVKWDHDLRTTDTPGLVVSRALQLSMAEPTGPSYLSIPRDVAMRPIDGDRFPSVADLNIPEAPAGDPDAVRAAARLLVEAENPLLHSASAGRDPRAFLALVALAELLGLPFSETNREKANFPNRHPLYGGGPPLDEADVVVVVESVTPWLPGYDEPRAEARVISIGIDPLFSTAVHYEFTADLRLAGSPTSILRELYVAAERLLTDRHRARIAERTERIAAQTSARRARLDREAQAQRAVQPITPTYAAYALGQVLDEDEDSGSLLLNENSSTASDVGNHIRCSAPDTAFGPGGAAGGWGPGAAFGAKLAAPDKLVVLTTGDGFYLYGVPYAALWAAVKYRAPFLTMVFQNRAYATGTTAVVRHYPNGYSVREGDFEGGRIDPPLDLARMAESAGAYGENVTDPGTLIPALKRAVDMVRNGTPAVVSVEVTPLGR